MQRVKINEKIGHRAKESNGTFGNFCIASI